MCIGNAGGALRMFDFAGREHKALLSKELHGHELTCVDIHPSGAYIAVGTRRGLIAIWDVQKFSILKTFVSGSKMAILCVKFIRSDKLSIIWSDALGDIMTTEFTKSVIGYNANTTTILRDKYAFSLCELQPNDLYPTKLDELSIMAVAGMNAVYVVYLEKEARVLWDYKRRDLAGKGALPCVDWGRGALPEDPENSNLILAIGWDRVIQLVEIKEAFYKEEGYGFNGYYVSDFEIRAMYWMAESILLVVNSRNEIRILYTGNFLPGRCPDPLGRRITMKDGVELERAYRMVEPFVLFETTMGKEQEELRVSCQPTVVRSGGRLLGLTSAGVLEGRLRTWMEFCTELRAKSQWVAALTVSVELYSGAIKGFAEMSTRKDIREAALKAFMKNFLYETLTQNLEDAKKVQSSTSTAAALTQAQITIEYCIKIAASDMLFKTLFGLFSDNDLDDVFMQAMEPFVLAGKFETTELPSNIFQLLVDYYIRRNRAQALEQALLCLCLTGQDLDKLSMLCVTHRLFSALIYIKTRGNSESEFVEPLIFMASDMRRERRDKGKVRLEDIYSSPREVEDSSTYSGYKILWYIDMCFKGVKYPQRQDTNSQIEFGAWPLIVYAIINWLLLEQNGTSNMKELMKHDFVCTLRVIKALFENENTRSFICAPEKYKSKEGYGFHYLKILEKVHTIVEGMPSEKKAPLFVYSKMLAKIAAIHDIKIGSDWCVDAAGILNESTSEYDGSPIDRRAYEELILGMLKNTTSFSKEQIDFMIGKFRVSPYIEVLVYLLEMKGEYTKCFDAFLGSRDPAASKKIFVWLRHIAEVLGEDSQHYAQLKTAIYEKLERLVRCV